MGSRFRAFFSSGLGVIQGKGEFCLFGGVSQSVYHDHCHRHQHHQETVGSCLLSSGRLFCKLPCIRVPSFSGWFLCKGVGSDNPCLQPRYDCFSCSHTRLARVAQPTSRVEYIVLFMVADFADSLPTLSRATSQDKCSYSYSLSFVINFITFNIFFCVFHKPKNRNVRLTMLQWRSICGGDIGARVDCRATRGWDTSRWKMGGIIPQPLVPCCLAACFSGSVRELLEGTHACIRS